MYFRALDTGVLSQCGTCVLLLYCPCSVSRQTSWWSVYLLTCALLEQCRQCWQIRREPWPRTSPLKANWCLQAGAWKPLLILTLIIVLASVSTAGDFKHILASADKWCDLRWWLIYQSNLKITHKKHLLTGFTCDMKNLYAASSIVQKCVRLKLLSLNITQI